MNLVSNVETIYVQELVVRSVDEITRTVYDSGVGKDATTKEIKDGWMIRFRDSTTALRTVTKPSVKPGDKMKATWEIVR